MNIHVLVTLHPSPVAPAAPARLVSLPQPLLHSSSSSSSSSCLSLAPSCAPLSLLSCPLLRFCLSSSAARRLPFALALPPPSINLFSLLPPPSCLLAPEAMHLRTNVDLLARPPVCVCVSLPRMLLPLLSLLSLSLSRECFYFLGPRALNAARNKPTKRASTRAALAPGHRCGISISRVEKLIGRPRKRAYPRIRSFQASPGRESGECGVYLTVIGEFDAFIKRGGI